MQEINSDLKHLQNLFSWSEFYASNKDEESYRKTQQQIKDQKALIDSKKESIIREDLN